MKENRQEATSRLDILWAPWRTGYVVSMPKRGCFLCKARKDATVPVYQSKHAFIILNTFPYSNGHLLVVPTRHVAHICHLTTAEEREIARLVRLSVAVLEETMRPHGMNIGVNLGRAAGAGLKSHLHVHVVPRWEGDTNFMPVICGTKVIPDSLDRMRTTLRSAFQRRASR